MSPGKHNQPHNNPYASAAGAYGTNAQKTTADPRELEARVLLKSAQFMQDLQQDWDRASGQDREDILKYNRSIWMMFYDTALENTDGAYPDDLRANILNLSNFIFKREIDILAKPEKTKLDILININRNIASGLLKGANIAKASKDEPENAAQAIGGVDTKTPPSGGGTDTSA